ncbi:hypothetical protein L1987_50207 [Smallanthus sonchifolius]|uniref:Uncharacterized protein n=1 Tax=Smallanthus sonchifolius TaxID=185202 RepID=A0ACB9FXE7_9ASTR|nr:hypothetical protein L1987_50207 [Smallanthus sonchifolius]
MSMALEALAISYLTHTVLNVWTWLAFLTAALSFWKIKSSIHSPPPPHHQTLPSPSPRQTSADQQPSITKRIPLFVSSTTFYSLENRRIGKFRVYYGEDDDCIAIGRSERCHPEDEERPIRQVDGWEAVLKLKTAEMGWYSYQDLTVLDGSVVRLWNQSNNHHVRTTRLTGY